MSLPVRKVLDCEKLCLHLAEYCRAVNVIYTDDNYICDMMETFLYTPDQVPHLIQDNPIGKLIVKQGKHRLRLGKV